MESTTEATSGGSVVESKAAHFSTFGPSVAASNMVNDNFANDYLPSGNYIHSDNDFEKSIPYYPLDDAPNYEALFCQAFKGQVHDALDHEALSQVFEGQHIVDQEMSDLYIGINAHDELGVPDLFMAVDKPDSHNTADGADTLEITVRDNFPNNQPVATEACEGLAARNARGTAATTPKEMHKFMKFPAEIRLMIWEMAIADAKFEDPANPRGKHGAQVQRFRFNLVYDATRLKPGQDKSWGWVACFTPLKINAGNPRLVFLRASVESRAIAGRKLSLLTVHEVPVDADGNKMAPRKCHVPFNFAKDDFCVEGITLALKEAKQDKKDKDAVWDPEKLPLSELLDNALGLRFAPRIKRLAIVIHWEDKRDALRTQQLLMQTSNARDMATLAKRFSALVTVKTALPLWSGIRCWFRWTAASVRGRGRGGPSGMSDEDREFVYRKAWGRLFDYAFFSGWSALVPDLFDGGTCIL